MEDAPTMETESAMVLEGLAVGVDYLEAIVVFLLTATHTYASWVAKGSTVRPLRIAEGLRASYRAAEDAHRALDGDGPPRADHPTLTIETPAHLVMVHRVRAFGVAACFAREAPLGFARMAARQIVATLEQDLPYPQEPVATIIAPNGMGQDTARMRARSFTPSSPVAIEPDEPPPPRGSSPRVVAVPDVALVAVPRPGIVEAAPPGIPTTPGTTVVQPGPIAPPALDFDEPAPDTTPPRSTIGDRVRAVVSHLEAIASDPHIVRMRLALRTGLGLEAFVYPDQLGKEALLLIETAAEDILGLDRGKLAEVSRP